MDFTSNPDHALVSIDDSLLQATPFSFKLSRNEEYKIMFHKNGYSNRVFILKPDFQGGWLVMDIFTVYGLIVDGITGAWHDWDYDFVYGVLDKN